MNWKFSGDRPVYQQIMELMRGGIVKGELPPGGKIPSVRELAAQAQVNPNTMQRAMTELEREGLLVSGGTSIAAHIREHRMEAAARLLAQTDMSIADVARQVGYDSQSRFSAAFKAYYRMLPKEYRRKCASQEIFPDASTLDT